MLFEVKNSHSFFKFNDKMLVKEVRNMVFNEIVKNVLSLDISQIELANYLDITRQTVAKIKNDGYFKLSKKASAKLLKLQNRSKEEIQKILQIDRFADEIKNRVLDGDIEYIDAAYEGFSYMHYWITDDKFVSQPKYHKFYFGHMNNFYPRFNQAALFMRDMLNRQSYPLVTYQLDYKRNMITDFSIQSFIKVYDKPEFLINDIIFPISFEQFANELSERILPQAKFLIYKDYKDDDWAYIMSHLKHNPIQTNEIYDLSRLFNFFENQQPYYGPLIEHVLEQFKVEFETEKVLKDCHYRGEKIIELINMVSLQDLHEKKHDKSSMIFDSHGFKRENTYIQTERRKLKMGEEK